VITNVIFDLGGVLVEWNPEKVLRGFYADDARRGLLMAQLYQHSDWLDLDAGTLAEEEALGRLASRVGGQREELAGLFEATRASLTPKPDSVELLEKLHQQGLGLYCISNMPASSYAYLRARHAFFGRFRGVAISGQLQLMKPDARIFRHLLEAHGLMAQHTAFVDDSVKNVQAAEALGLKGVRFQDAAQCARELAALIE
jgi:putative hydrolase of the HAD superfamily